MVNRNSRLLATWESVAKHLMDGALQHAEQCLQKNYLRWMKLLGYANCFDNVKQRLIFKKSSGVLRQNAVKKYAYLERCYGSAQIGRQSCLPIRRACEMLNISVSGFYECPNSGSNDP